MPQLRQTSKDIIGQAYDFAERWMRDYDASHDFSHIQRVLRLALHIAESARADAEKAYDVQLVQLAALLHDVGDRKYAAPGHSATPIYDFLISVDAGEETSRTVQLIADCVSFSKEKENPALIQSTLARHPELGVVQDADRLDALGAIGIGRCFTFGSANAERNKTTAAPHDSSADKDFCMHHAIEHFQEKLVKLQRLMKTETGKRLAQQRTERLLEFEKWWKEEQLGAF